MKAITLWRPWDQAILHGGKDFENRPWALWKSQIGEPIALHAGKKYDKDGALWMIDEGLYTPPIDSPEGIVGVVTFDRIIHLDTCDLQELNDPWFFGPYGWHVEKKISFSWPILCRGKQGLWNVPPEIEERITDILKKEGW